jgi:hypothetical protein
MTENAQNPADLHTEPAPSADDGGTPSATVPGASVQPHGGQESPEQSTDGSYNDGNLDARGVMPAAGRPQVLPEDEESLDDELDSSPRTDGKGRPDEDDDDQAQVRPAPPGRPD